MQKNDFPVAVIPAYNEARGIRSLVERVRAVGAAVIVVDDGSTDTTAPCLEGLGITILRNPVNMGKGASLQRGFAAALRLGASAVITLDGDGQHRPEDIPRLLAAAKAWPGRIIIGARTGNRRAAPPLRRFANRFADFWISWAAGSRMIRDSQSGFRLYPAEFLRQVQLRPDTRNTFVFESEILIIAAHLGWFTEAVAIETIYHQDGISNYRAWADTWLIVRRVAGHLFCRGMYPAGLLRVLCLLPDPRAEGP
jgi:glycosyltransferase involved in cell wall biosynthesis